MMRSVFSTKSFKYLPINKSIHNLTASKFEEVSIPVPWGHISGKWWGPTDSKPILCLHGFGDNCGSFDKLIPFLTKDKYISFLAIDFPGHGFSSPLPQGMIYNFLSYTILIQQIYEYFKWSKLSFLGHSLGSMVSLVSTVLYPEKVDFVICIDALGPLVSNVCKKSVRKSIDDYMKYSKFIGEPPTYTWEEIIQKINTAYKNPMSLDSIMCLLERNIASSKNIPGKFYFTHDPRIKVNTMFNWKHEQMIHDAATIDNPMFVCEATNNNFQEHRKDFREIVDVLRRHSKDCEYHLVEGIHHLHLEEPDKLGALIRKFFNKHYTAENSNLKDFSIFSAQVPSSLRDQNGSMKINRKL